ncbi:L-lactate dehydrogenase [Kallotenue papyrolyticum]|uniref:L-lactate dehydrogenase n=1 Tax=Kallotenue papyrolyticum TaxID=1325125 RepID=UPI000492446B|nr:L-lactate dehydrogenase [Kallotenue papyrolyticum]
MTGLRESGPKIGVVGTGMVGASFAYALMQSSLATELVLIDANRGRAEAEAMDLNHGLPFVRPMRIWAGDYADLAGAAVTVVTAGAAQKPGETRLQLLERNVAIFHEIIPQIVRHNPDGMLLIATNPVDILTYHALRISGLPPAQVIGSGTILDTARFRYLLGRHYRVDPRSVHAYIVGEHGDSELALWSLANIGGVRLRDFRSSGGVGYDEAALQRIFEQTRDAAYAIIERKGATYYAIGLGLLTIVEAILRDQHTVMTVSSLMTGQYGVSEICISLPTIVGAAGVEEVLNLTLSPEEEALFRASAQTLQERYAQVQSGSSTAPAAG